MSEAYFKTDANIIHSSMWDEDAAVCKIWITILALKDQHTHVLKQSVKGIAHAARQPVEAVETAIAKFEAPDPHSTTPDNEGRRMQRLSDGGWLILNGEKYKELGWSDDKKRYERERKQKYRNKPEQKKPEIESTYHKDSRTVLHMLNFHTGKTFREVDSNLSVISARLSEKGVTLEGVKKMVIRMCQKWKSTPQEDYLRPETLFGKTKFDSYYAAKDQPINETNQSGGGVRNPRNAGCTPNSTDYEKAAKARTVGSEVASPELPLQ